MCMIEFQWHSNTSSLANAQQVAEHATQFFIEDDRPNVAGLVLAGSAAFKQELSLSPLFDQRLKKIVLKLVDVSYGGENGFNQAIDLSAECLSEVKFIQEKKLMSRYFDEISRGTMVIVFPYVEALSFILGTRRSLVADAPTGGTSMGAGRRS